METVKAWVVTFDPHESIRAALGPNDPDAEEAILVFLTYDEAQKYVYDSGMLGASIVEVEVNRGKLPGKFSQLDHSILSRPQPGPAYPPGVYA